MKGLSVTLIVCLAASRPTLTAQEYERGSTGPVGREVSRAAIRLAHEPVAPKATSRESQERPTPSSGAQWSRVRDLDEGTEITVTANGVQTGVRYVIDSDDSSLTVLNVSGVSDRNVTSALIDTAADRPERFIAARAGKSYSLGDNVHLVPDGVYLGTVRVASVAEVVARIPRDQVLEISVVGTSAGAAMATGAFAGGSLGLLWGVTKYDDACGRFGCFPAPQVGRGAFIGLSVAALAGAGIGVGALVGARHKTQHVIYRLR